MGVLDSIMQMKNEGRSDSEVIQILRSQGVPPKEIQEAINQAQIKNAVAGANTQGMQQSIMDTVPSPQEDSMQQEAYYPQQDYSYQQAQPAYPMQQDPYANQGYAQDYSQNYATGDQNYYQDNYAGDYQQGYAPTTSDTNTLIEISEQVFSEKIKKVQETLDTINEFKALTDTKVKVMEERLKRIEGTIDQLQLSILDKIGSYGKNISSIKKEMEMIQDSFGKVIDPLLDKRNQLRKRL